ncbi:MAG TPA: class I SAM-dependent methyltransferase, partial [Puia sp.]|nr:class I SAM-dependent methyltransferase [Puia sp.]
MSLLRKVKNAFLLRFPMEKNKTKRIISFWEKGGPDFGYFKAADQKGWVDTFWKKDSVFYSLFQQLNLESVLEIACGAGRHSLQVASRIQKLYLLDSSAGALEIAREKFNGYPQVTYLHNPEGLGIPREMLPDGSVSTVFSYDAMVHFEKECVDAYIKDSFRVLKPGGLALLHHSNYDKNPEGIFSSNPGWRNYMSWELFTQMAKASGFRIIESKTISYTSENSD